MNIWIFYRDAFARGGFPNEIRALAASFGKSNSVLLIGKNRLNDGIDSNTINVKTLKYSNIFNLQKNVSHSYGILKPDITIVVGFFIIDNIFFCNYAKKGNSKVILYPLSQVSSSVINSKIFTADPSVRNLENKSKQASNSFLLELLYRCNPILKKLYLDMFGSFLIRRSDYIACMSKNEALELKKYLKVEGKKIVNLQLGTYQIDQCDSSNYYDESGQGIQAKLNFVYWGRLDWRYKGIDRLIDGVYELKKTCNNLDFIIHLIGPNYRDGVRKIKKRISDLKLNKDFNILLPHQYTRASIAPLRDADASILLSRWDGFPRSLRESLHLNVPILVSRETNFADIVDQHNCGISINNSDNPEEVATALREFSDIQKLSTMRIGTNKATNALQWDFITNQFVKTFKNNRDNI